MSAHHYADKPFQILASELQKHVDCTACANCCRHAVVSVTESEIEKIAAQIGTTPEAVSHLYTVPDPEAPALRLLRNSGEGCVFLDDNLCMIYEARPKACRDFPHVTVGTHSLGGRQSSLGRWAALCPIIFNALEAYKHLTGYPRRVADSGGGAGDWGQLYRQSRLDNTSRPAEHTGGRTAYATHTRSR